MVNQGRLVKVMIVLMVAMTSGALILLTLEGRPIKPMPFSLSRQTQLTDIDDALTTTSGIEIGRWKRIQLAYEPNNGRIADSKPLTADLALKYHFVIADQPAGDGKIYTSPRWIRQLTCLSPDAKNNSHNIRICILLGPEQNSCSPRQDRQRQALVLSLVKQCQIEPKTIWKNKK